MRIRCRTVRVEELESGAVRFGVLAEAEDGRALVALGAASREELDAALDECGGEVGYVRRWGRSPLDPAGVAPDADGAPAWVPPAGG